MAVLVEDDEFPVRKQDARPLETALGYPCGLSGDGIPLAARIAALADVYDALTSHRVYKDAMSHTKARSIIVDLSGRQFDPSIVRAFSVRESDFERLALELREKVGANQTVPAGDRTHSPVLPSSS